MKAWAYLRTSTDDKAQDPERQMDRIRPWAASQGVEVLGSNKDEGKSGLKTAPFERAGFKLAIDNALDKGCQALVVETGDRFTRKGTRHFWVFAYQLQERYGLRLWEADAGDIQQQESGLGEILASIKAMAANEWIVNHSKRVKSGMARKRCKLPEGHVVGPDCNGTHFGHPSKMFSHKEMERVWEARQGLSPVGWRTLTLELNRARGAFEIAGEERRRELMVSSVTVRRLYANLERAKSAGLAAHPGAPEGVPV